MVKFIIASVASRPVDTLLVATSVVIFFCAATVCFSHGDCENARNDHARINAFCGCCGHQIKSFQYINFSSQDLRRLDTRIGQFFSRFLDGINCRNGSIGAASCYFFIWRLMLGNALWEKFGLSYLIASCLYSAKPSASDAVIAIKHPVGLILLAMVVWVYFKYFSN